MVFIPIRRADLCFRRKLFKLYLVQKGKKKKKQLSDVLMCSVEERN